MGIRKDKKGKGVPDKTRKAKFDSFHKQLKFYCASYRLFSARVESNYSINVEKGRNKEIPQPIRESFDVEKMMALIRYGKINYPKCSAPPRNFFEITIDGKFENYEWIDSKRKKHGEETVGVRIVVRKMDGGHADPFAKVITMHPLFESELSIDSLVKCPTNILGE